MGDAYRASGRTTPIFDVFDIHPYPPIQDTDPFTKPFQWPQAGAANLDRIKQALWDAFHGTGQPTPAEQPAAARRRRERRAVQRRRRCRSHSTRSASRRSITGHEAAYTDGPDSIAPISEQQQAANHVALMEIAACDPDVESLFFFPLIDESDVHNGLPVRQPLRRPPAQAVVRCGEGEDRLGPGRLPQPGPGCTRRGCWDGR